MQSSMMFPRMNENADANRRIGWLLDKIKCNLKIRNQRRGFYFNKLLDVFISASNVDIINV